MPAASAAPGVAAHFLNTLPDLLPHPIGGQRSQALAAVLTPAPVFWAGLLIAAVLAVGALTGRGRTPFRCGVAIAGVNVILLALAAT